MICKLNVYLWHPVAELVWYTTSKLGVVNLHPVMHTMRYESPTQRVAKWGGLKTVMAFVKMNDCTILCNIFV